MKLKYTYFTILAIILVSVAVISSYAILSTNQATGETSVTTARFIVKLNNSLQTTQTIDLADTITSNNYSDTLVVPGTNGTFNLELDFSQVDVAVDYQINLPRTNVPANLKYYSDSNYTSEITSISGTYLLSDASTTKTNTVYWKWNYLNTTEANADDNNYQDTAISIPITVTVAQKVGGGN